MSTSPVKSVPERPIRARRIRFNYPQGGMNRHYVQGDLVPSHIVAVLSAVFPEGEDFFVRSVRHYSDQITDPELKAAVAGFVGQEVTHGREHRALNDRLQEMGYPTHFVDRLAYFELAVLADRYLPPRIRLAITAALEHYTATLAELLLTEPDLRELLGEGEVRSMLLWHALEESEHKAVAFDVFKLVGGTERERVWTMRLISAGFVVQVALNTLQSMATDRDSYRPSVLLPSLNRARKSPDLQQVGPPDPGPLQQARLPPERPGQRRADRAVEDLPVRRAGHARRPRPLAGGPGVGARTSTLRDSSC